MSEHDAPRSAPSRVLPRFYAGQSFTYHNLEDFQRDNLRANMQFSLMARITGGSPKEDAFCITGHWIALASRCACCGIYINELQLHHKPHKAD